ncbi:hypothetical protein [Silvibacterium dinghuense]|nr:hypothetical protein [Silvibacterium dinghuense]GGH06920.1 hypothetical protein GCM10011586_23910 [Silvibacterium dinghuense]
MPASAVRPASPRSHLGLACMLAAGALLLAPAIAQAQVSYTAMPLDSGFGPLDTSEPTIPPQQIIDQFTAKESVFRQAMDNYTYERSVKVETLNDDNKVDGQYYEVTDISFDPDGKRMEHVVLAPASTLERVQMSPADFQDIEQRLPFVLTKEDVGQYDLHYVGRQKIDDVDTYVFDVAPKKIEKPHRYFQGRIWVDQHDLQIVVTDGKNVPDDTRKGHEDLSPPFVTYREQIDGKYWFPVYTKGDGILHFSGGHGYLSQDVHIRETLKYTNYKHFNASVRVLFQGQDITNNGQQQPDQKPPQKPQ